MNLSEHRNGQQLASRSLRRRLPLKVGYRRVESVVSICGVVRSVEPRDDDGLEERNDLVIGAFAKPFLRLCAAIGPWEVEVGLLPVDGQVGGKGRWVGLAVGTRGKAPLSIRSRHRSAPLAYHVH